MALPSPAVVQWQIRQLARPLGSWLSDNLANVVSVATIGIPESAYKPILQKIIPAGSDQAIVGDVVKAANVVGTATGIGPLGSYAQAADSALGVTKPVGPVVAIDANGQPIASAGGTDWLPWILAGGAAWLLLKD